MSFVVSIPADDLPLIFEELVVDVPLFAAEVRPHLEALVGGDCAASFGAYASAVRSAVDQFDANATLGADVYSLGVAICRG